MSAALDMTLDVDGAAADVDEYRRLRQLWAQLMITTLDDYNRGSPHNRRAARHWLYDDSPRRFGFIWVCNVLDLDPEAVRDRLAAMPMRAGRGLRRASRCA